ncbi:metallophosphoesterase family protein [Candidatus Dependentiae bacterium]
MFFENKKQCIWGLLFIFFFPQLDADKFVAIGDLHSGKTNYKTYYCDKILDLKIAYPEIDMILISGDLTDSNKIISSTSGTWKEEQTVITDHSQWGILNSLWRAPLEAAGIEVKMSQGNHDQYYRLESENNMLQPISVADMLKYHYSTSYPDHQFTHYDFAYAFKKVNTYFISCGVYPDGVIRGWLKSYLEDTVKTSPVFFFFHYPVCGKRGPEDFRDAFYNKIKNYNVGGIFTGHVKSFTYLWNGIPILSCGGKYFSVVDCDLSTGVIDLDETKFYGALNNTSDVFIEKGFYDPDLYGIE